MFDRRYLFVIQDHFNEYEAIFHLGGPREVGKRSTIEQLGVHGYPLRRLSSNDEAHRRLFQGGIQALLAVDLLKEGTFVAITKFRRKRAGHFPSTEGSGKSPAKATGAVAPIDTIVFIG